MGNKKNATKKRTQKAMPRMGPGRTAFNQPEELLRRSLHMREMKKMKADGSWVPKSEQPRVRTLKNYIINLFGGMGGVGVGGILAGGTMLLYVDNNKNALNVAQSNLGKDVTYELMDLLPGIEEAVLAKQARILKSHGTKYDDAVKVADEVIKNPDNGFIETANNIAQTIATLALTRLSIFHEEDVTYQSEKRRGEVALKPNYNVILQISTPCQSASKKNHNPNPAITIAFMKFIILVEKFLRMKIPISVSWHEQTRSDVVADWMRGGIDEGSWTLSSIDIYGHDFSVPQLRPRVLWFSNHRRRAENSLTVARKHMSQFGVLARNLQVDTVLGLKADEWKLRHNNKSKTEKEIDGNNGPTITSSPPCLVNKSTGKEVKLSVAQLLVLQGFDPHIFVLPWETGIEKNLSKMKKLIADAVPVQLSLAAFRSVFHGAPPPKETVSFDKSWTRNTHLAVAVDELTQLGMNSSNYTVDPPDGKNWEPFRMFEPSIMRATDGLKVFRIGNKCKKKWLSDGSSYVDRLADVYDKLKPEDRLCAAGCCNQRGIKVNEVDGLSRCKNHHAQSVVPREKRNFLAGRGNKRVHRECSVCCNVDIAVEKTPMLDAYLAENRKLERDYWNPLQCEANDCPHNICRSCLTSLYVEPAQLGADKNVFHCWFCQQGKGPPEYVFKQSEIVTRSRLCEEVETLV
jgi:hypothetical protein